MFGAIKLIQSEWLCVFLKVEGVFWRDVRFYPQYNGFIIGDGARIEYCWGITVSQGYEYIGYVFATKAILLSI